MLSKGAGKGTFSGRARSLGPAPRATRADRSNAGRSSDHDSVSSSATALTRPARRGSVTPRSASQRRRAQVNS